MKIRRKINFRNRGVAKETAPSKVRKKTFSSDSNLPSNKVLYLQQTLGNAALQRLLKSGVIQAKLKVGEPNDIYEQEANRVAEQVTRKQGSDTAKKQADRPQPIDITHINQSQLEKKEIQENFNFEPVNSLVQRQDEDEEKLQMKASEERSQGLSSDAENRIKSLDGRGSPLPDSVREYLEPRFGKDFSAVRIHHDSDANEMARDVNAKAFTFGRNVVFGAGRYEPDKNEGLGLIAHELTHVVQQNNASMVRAKSEKTGKSNTNFEETEYQSYPVSGKTLKEAVESMPADEAGETTWDAKYSLKTNDKEIITEADVNIKIKVTMPHWPNAKNLPENSKKEWKRFYKALEKHEKRHVDLVKKKLANLADSLLGKTQLKAEETFNKALEKLKKANDAYDKKTDHGRKKGTTIDINKD